MAIIHARHLMYSYQRDSIAAEGLCVIGVEFRNCAGADGNNVWRAHLREHIVVFVKFS
jgi:hypothetical protein